MLLNDRTIAAIASPVGIAGVGVIRLSGAKSLSIIQKVFSSSAFKIPITPNHMYVGHLHEPGSDEPIDHCCVVYFKGPKSFTGDDVVEVHCHSSPYLLKRILDLLLSQGADLAEKGEFTKQAFLNGKCDLTQAESLIDLIHSESERQHHVSLNRVQGKLYQHIQAFRAVFLRLLEEIEGSIDFPEEVPEIDRSAAIKELGSIQSSIQHILSLQDFGTLISGGIHCVCVGKPNAGKSSLFNAMISQDRSIVTDIPGTTRDYISESIQYDGYLYHMYDTAGLRDSDDIIEYMGMKKIHELIEKATILLFVIDQSQPLSDDDRTVFNIIKEKKNLAIVLMKSDLEPAITQADVKAFNPLFVAQCSVNDTNSIASLKAQIHEHSIGHLSEEDMEYICNVRQLSCIRKLDGQVSQVLQSLHDAINDDLISVDLRACLESCSELVGDSLTEELLDGIFSRFCVGK